MIDSPNFSSEVIEVARYLLLSYNELRFPIYVHSHDKVLHLGYTLHPSDIIQLLLSEDLLLLLVKLEVERAFEVLKIRDGSINFLLRVAAHKHTVCEREKVSSLVE